MSDGTQLSEYIQESKPNTDNNVDSADPFLESPEAANATALGNSADTYSLVKDVSAAPEAEDEEEIKSDTNTNTNTDANTTNIVYNENDQARGEEAEEEKATTAESVVLYTIMDTEQEIPDKVKDKENPDNPLNTVDPEWKYNITLGDVEKRRITLFDGKVEELWFPIEDSVRKVFVAFKIKRVSEVDNVAETFRMRFHIYFNWLATEEDFKSYYQAKVESKSMNAPELLLSWEPKWYPHLEFQNMIEEQVREWEVYPEEGAFRMQTFKDFAKKKNEKIAEDRFDCQAARFLRAKLECEMTFAEELELQSFPFDCQDLSCVIHERTTGGVRCVFLPELRKPNFASIDPRYSVIDEWDLETAILEFGDADSNASRSRTSYAMIVLRLKVKRRWRVYMWNIVFLMFCIMGLTLTAFALDADDLGDRLNLLITLALTAVVFSYVVFEELPNVPYLTWMDKYILGSYAYIVAIMIETAFLVVIPPAVDFWIFVYATFHLFAYQIGCLYYAKILRTSENEKLYFSSDEIEADVNASRPSLRFDYTKRMRSGKNGRLLSYLGYMQSSVHMGEKQKDEIVKSQQKLEVLFVKQATARQEKEKIKKEMKDLLAEEQANSAGK